MKAYIQLCLAMSQLAKMVRTASPKPQQTDNEKYAMRCWMLRLGFIGDEFATAREILLRNMEGNASLAEQISWDARGTFWAATALEVVEGGAGL